MPSGKLIAPLEAKYLDNHYARKDTAPAGFLREADEKIVQQMFFSLQLFVKDVSARPKLK